MRPLEQTLIPSFSRAPSRVAIRRAASYESDLEALLFETLREFRLPVGGKSVLLKPNFVCPDPQGRINTHPALVAAARASFLRLGAREVRIGDGPALDRDTEAIAESMRLKDFIGPLDKSFVDLNADDARRVALPTRASRLKELFLPATVLRADFVVSMPKLKTHHWAGVTLSLKNMFGIVPGGCYGWPKNILHWMGIDRAILDINAAVRPDFSIVDGIVGMEGDGPIQGEAKHCGLIIMGDDPVAVDATCARLMAFQAEKIPYLVRAGHLLGHLKRHMIRQLGESVDSARTPFRIHQNFERIRETIP